MSNKELIKCPICTIQEETGLMSTQTTCSQLSNSIRPCSKCQAQLDLNRVAIIEAAEGFDPDENTVPLETPRSGQILFIDVEDFDRIFGQELRRYAPMMFACFGVIDQMMANNSTKH